jgi:hypothetical protein
MNDTETLAVIGLGIAVFYGAFQMRPHYRFLALLIWTGSIIIAGTSVNAVWLSGTVHHPLIDFLTLTGILILAIITWFAARDTHRSAHVQDYIRIWERNYENWDGGKPNDRFDLTEGQTPKTISLPVQKNPARFTPVFQSPYDSIEENAFMTLLFIGKGLKFDNDDLREWRPISNSTDVGCMFGGHVDKPLHAGKTKVGPDGVLKVHFPVGTHRVNYKIEGCSKKGCDFMREGHFLLRIYDGIK